MDMGKIVRELQVEPLLYPAAMPQAPREPESIPAAEPVGVADEA